jgi:hypothetical protein
MLINGLKWYIMAIGESAAFKKKEQEEAGLRIAKLEQQLLYLPQEVIKRMGENKTHASAGTGYEKSIVDAERSLTVAKNIHRINYERADGMNSFFDVSLSFSRLIKNLQT